MPLRGRHRDAIPTFLTSCQESGFKNFRKSLAKQVREQGVGSKEILPTSCFLLLTPQIKFGFLTQCAKFYSFGTCFDINKNS